jgi:2-polyprenyl-6-methoxyphenol hydroxylase-like FAD-dependent oxidoreductase
MKVLIAGAGIAGPATAIALHKAGIASVLYEARPEDATDAGAFVTIAANGQDALHAIGARGPVLDASFPASRMRIFDPAGTQVADIPLGRDHPGPRTITRSRLASVLRQEAAARGVPVEYGKRLTTAARTGTGVRVLFADGSHADGDVLVGADGIRSPVRTAIDPAAPGPRYTGLMIACGYAAGAAATADPGCYDMIHGSRAFLGHTAGPDGRAWWFARVPGPELTGRDLAAPAACWRDRLADAFAADSTPAAALIRSTSDPVTVTVTSAYDIPALPTWHNDTMTVTGDAAHAASPSTAQGASMALEDAAVLAQCLRDVPAIPEALALFEKLRRDRVERIVRAGASGENPAPPSPPPGPRRGNPAEWLFAHHIDWHATITLPRSDRENHPPNADMV